MGRTGPGRHDVVVVGSINADLVVALDRHPRPGETLLGRAVTWSAGGKGANQAVAAARLGAATALVGAVGTDPNAAIALSELGSAAVDLTHVATTPGATGLAVVMLADGGENTIVVVPGANTAVTPQVVGVAAPTLRAAAVLALQAEIPVASVDLAASLAAAAGVRVLLNLAPAVAVSAGTLALADPLVVNELELTVVLRSLGLPAGAGTDPVARASSGARLLRGHGVRSVLVTLGAAGVVGADRGGEWAVPARPVLAVDTVGAGDAFAGALAGRLAAGATLQDAAETAVRAAAFSVQRPGAQSSYPWSGEVLP